MAKVKPCLQGDRHLVRLQVRKHGGWISAVQKRTNSARKAIFKRSLTKTTLFRAWSRQDLTYFPDGYGEGEGDRPTAGVPPGPATSAEE